MPRLGAPRLIVGLFVGDIVLGLAYLANQLAGNPRVGLNQFLDLGGEANLPTWWSSMQLFLSGVLMTGFARRHFKKTEPGTWVLALLAATLLLMSCDEVAQIHERLGGHSDALLPGGSRANTVFKYTGIWMFVIGIPFIAVLSVMLWKVRPYFAVVRGSLSKMVIGFVLLLFGALFMDGLSNLFAMHSPTYNVAVLVEETLEMLGMTTICWSALDLVSVDGATFAAAFESAVKN